MVYIASTVWPTIFSILSRKIGYRSNWFCAYVLFWWKQNIPVHLSCITTIITLINFMKSNTFLTTFDSFLSHSLGRYAGPDLYSIRYTVSYLVRCLWTYILGQILATINVFLTIHHPQFPKYSCWQPSWHLALGTTN